MKLKLQRRDVDGGKSLRLNIRMEKTNSRRNMSRAFAPRFPKVEDSPYFVLIVRSGD